MSRMTRRSDKDSIEAFAATDTSYAAAFNALRTYLGNGLLAIGTLAKDATAEKFKTTTRSVIRYNGETAGKAAETAVVFTAAHVVSATKFGVILIQRTPAGVTSTKVPGATQAYNTAPLALAALPTADAGNVAIGYIAIAAGAADWTANTDDLTNASDLTTATFVDGTPLSLPSALS